MQSVKVILSGKYRCTRAKTGVCIKYVVTAPSLERSRRRARVSCRRVIINLLRRARRKYTRESGGHLSLSSIRLCHFVCETF